jgi:hypothetical protein
MKPSKEPRQHRMGECGDVRLARRWGWDVLASAGLKK